MFRSSVATGISSLIASTSKIIIWLALTINFDFEEIGKAAVIMTISALLPMAFQGGVQLLIEKSNKRDFEYINSVYITFIIIGSAYILSSKYIVDLIGIELVVGDEEFLFWAATSGVLLLLSTIPKSIIKSDLNYVPETVINILSVVIYSSVSFYFIFVERNIIKAIVFSDLSSNLVRLLLGHALAKYIPTTRISIEKLITNNKYVIYPFIANFGTYLSNNSLTLFLSKYADPVFLGQFYIAKRLSEYVFMLVEKVFGEYILALFSKLNNNAELVKTLLLYTYYRGLIVSPILALLISNAHCLATNFLGDDARYMGNVVVMLGAVQILKYLMLPSIKTLYLINKPRLIGVISIIKSMLIISVLYLIAPLELHSLIIISIICIIDILVWLIYMYFAVLHAKVSIANYIDVMASVYLRLFLYVAVSFTLSTYLAGTIIIFTNVMIFIFIFADKYKALFYKVMKMGK